MHTLILSCTTGEGHNACARAIKEYYDSVGAYATIADTLAFVSEDISRLISKGHILIYRKFSPVFEWGYEYAENHPKYFDSDSAIYHFIARGAESLYRFIEENCYDSIICTHPFSALMMTEILKRYHPAVHTALVATDYTCCPSVNCSELDTYFIPDERLEDEFVSKGISRDHLCPSGIPIRQKFFVHQEKSFAKQSLGLDPRRRHIVMACGSMGCGPMEKLSEMLAPMLGDEAELTIVCGTNEKLEESMRELHSDTPGIHVRGFFSDMPLLLDSADVYITKPGGLSVTEAMAKRVPMVLVNAVGGCESYNLHHLVEQGSARTAESLEELAQICMDTVRDCEQFRSNAPEQKNAAPIIYNTMKKESETYEKSEIQSACPLR